MYTDRFLFMCVLIVPPVLLAAGSFVLSSLSFIILFPVAMMMFFSRRSMLKRISEKTKEWKSEVIIFEEVSHTNTIEDAEEIISKGRLVAKYGQVDIFDELLFDNGMFAFDGVVPLDSRVSAVRESARSEGVVRIVFGCLRYKLLSESGENSD